MIKKCKSLIDSALSVCKKVYAIPIMQFVLLLVTALTFQNAYSQKSEQWHLSKKLNGDNGRLPQNTVTGLYFDKETGFLWISTQGGLIRYNGVESKVFDQRNLPKISSSRIGAFFSTVQGNVVTFNYWDYQIQLNKNLPVVTNRQAAYLGTARTYHLTNLNWKVAQNDSVYLAIPSEAGHYLSYTSESAKVVWLNDSCRVIADRGKFFFLTNDKLTSTWPMKPWNNINFIQTSKKIFAVTSDGIGYSIDRETKIVTSIGCDRIFKAKDLRIFSRIESETPLALDKNVLYTIECRENFIGVKLLGTLPETPLDITSLTINPNGHEIYCGSETSGVFIYAKTFLYTYKLGESDSSFSHLNKSYINNTYAVVLTDSTHVVSNTGLLIDLKQYTYRYLSLDNTDRRLMIPMEQGKFMFHGTHLLYQEVGDANTGKVYSDKSISWLHRWYPGNNNSKWITTSYYLAKLEGDSVRDKYLYTQYFAKARIGEGLTVIGETKANQLLVTDGYTIFYFDWRLRKITRQVDLPKGASEQGYFITDRYPTLDDDRYLWVPTYGVGYYLLDLSDNSIYKGPLDAKGHLLYAHVFIPDGQGNFLVPTNNGLFRVNRDQLIKATKSKKEKILYEYYDTNNGLVTNEFNGACVPAYNVLPDGDILLPSIGGLVRVYTNNFPISFRYPIFIESITTKDSVYTNPVNLHFDASERSQIWLINYSQWNADEPGERKIQINELTGGNHVLHIRNQYTLSDKEVSQLDVPFSVNRWYYEYKLFWFFVSILLIAIIILISNLRSDQLRKKNIALEQKIKEKNKQVLDKNALLEKTLDDLNELMYALENKNNFQKRVISLIGHDMMIPLKYINRVSAQLVAYKDKLKEETKNESIAEINNTAASLAYLGESIIHWIKLQDSSFSAEPVEMKFSDILKDLLPLHNRLAAEKNNTILVNVPENLSCTQDPVILKIILHNLLINANKFTPKGTISLVVNNTNGQLSMTIADSGVGMPDEIRDNLNQMRAVNSRKGTNKEAGWGLGYRLIIDLLRLCGGTLNVKSAEGQGTSIRITLPDPLTETATP